MTTFAVTDPAHTIAALNYALSNLNTGNVTGNTTIPGNVLVANATTNAISTYSGSTPISYVNQYLNVRYANTATGASGFSTNQANSQYYGVFNTVTTTNPGANNAANYQWFQVTGGFGTTKTLYYLCNGGRQVQLSATTTAPSSGYLPTVNGTPINLDVVTTANGTPGARGAIAMAYVLTPSDPNTGGNTALSTWFAASRTANVPPIGTGLTPVSGDTADFLWPTTNASGTYTFDGAGWASVVGQVVAGNTIVNGTITGNTIANSTITGNNIIVGTVSGDVIIANTLAGNTVIANTLYGNAIIANTIYGNAIIANTINGNSIIANTISGNSIIANSFTANSINGSSISAGSIAANTINGGSIVSGSITTNQLAANVLTANTVVSTGATIGNFASSGFWLQGSTGNARFGNSISIGNQLTVGINAQIGVGLTVGSGLIVGTSAQIGTFATIGSNLTVGANLVVGNNASIGANLIVGNNANIAANLRVGTGANIGDNLIVGTGANIGTNLIVGNNASIGGNLTVTGLITGSNLLANTVPTLTILPSNVSTASGVQSTSARIATNATSGAIYTLSGTATVDVPTPNAVITINWASSIYSTWSTGGTVYFDYALYRSVGGGAFTQLQGTRYGPFNPFVVNTNAGFVYVDTDTTSFGSGVTYRYSVAISPVAGNSAFTFLNIDRNFTSISAQNLKR